MINTSLINLKDIIAEYGNDLRNINLENKNFTKCDFTNVLLPENRELFQKAVFKSLKYSKFNNNDFSYYNMNGIDVEWCVFENGVKFPKEENFLINLKGASIRNTTINVEDLEQYSFKGLDIFGVKFSVSVKLPKKYDFFQIIKDKNISNVVLPFNDYSNYDFDDVCLLGTKFTEDSKITVTKDLFQKIKGKNLNFASLPGLDYSKCDFTGVSLSYTTFGKKTVFPKDYALFKKVAVIQESMLGDQYNDDIHLYDLKNIPYTLRINNISPLQTAILYGKYFSELKQNKIKIFNDKK